MKKLPKLYKNEINKNISNNKKYCYLENESIKEENINDKLENIFNGIGYSYNIPVSIKTKTKEYNTSLVSKTKNNIITLDNDVIKIDEIISLELK